MRNLFGSSQIQGRFDLAAAGEGWNQMFVSPDGQSFWVQQLCMDRLGSAGLTSADIIEPHIQPLFYGIRASTSSWCQAVRGTVSHTTNSHNMGSVAAYPIHYEVQCVKQQQFGQKLRLLIRLKLDQIRWVYQCLQIKSHADASVIQMLQSQSYAFEPKESLCGELNTFESVYWIPSLQKSTAQTSVTCPFDGGFQLTAIKVLNREKSICDYQTYGTLESDCIAGDGTEWSFDDPKCNLFEFKQVTKLSCLVSWEETGLTYVLLRLFRDDDGHTVYSMVYTDVPGKHGASTKSYQNPVPIWIGLGLRLPAKLSDSLAKANPHFRPHYDFIRNTIEHDHTLSGVWNDETRTYELQIRRAFGMCDDERTTCDRGCDFDARNRLFCYRTCAGDEKKCAYTSKKSSALFTAIKFAPIDLTVSTYEIGTVARQHITEGD
ncbi:unnamed protein product [Echinostoma caproni]|uniref:CUB domain-containing protein n=1 Tax=Echinostoma caproni TaxID=27848 RepID=A0A183A7E9_9TREM|nr:unnamed protein product [Echinostoma caproni]